MEITNNKVRHVDASQTLMSSQLSRVKDQVSVINEKLDSHTVSLVTIEQTLEGYSDMYRVNKDKIEDLDERVRVVEEHSGLTPQK